MHRIKADTDSCHDEGRQRVVNISIILMYCNGVKGIVTRGDVTVKGACGS